MAYKTCPDCGCRIFEYGCVNCNESDYIDMQQEYEPPPKVMIKGRDVQASVATEDDQGTEVGKQKQKTKK